MKRARIILLLTLLSSASFAQDITGQWNGLLKIQSIELRLVLHITKTENGYSSTMDSPDQNAIGIPVNNTTFEKGKLKFEIANLKVEYNGELKDDIITGILKQNGQEMPLQYTRTQVEKKIIDGYQEAEIKAPFPYYTEDVTFQNIKANITLAGTLTLPSQQGVFPVAILITGSGRQNRDEEIFGRKPFLIIADYLTKNGIAVLRYDDRGVAKSTGDFKTATSADFATDAESAIAYLKTRPEINKQKIGLIGHSEGGMIAPMVAAKSKDVSFIVMLAGLGIQGGELLLLQKELIDRTAGTPEPVIQKSKKVNARLVSLVMKSTSTELLKEALTKEAIAAYRADSATEFLFDQKYTDVANTLTSPWVQYLIRYNPKSDLQKVKCPVLVMNGEKDLQVPPAQNLSAIESALKKGNNKSYLIRQMPGMNHLFQECKTGSPDEYFKIPQTFSPIALKEISAWIITQTHGK
jgi:pimeloyl-ACP methyl ester carboxylesterase